MRIGPTIYPSMEGEAPARVFDRGPKRTQRCVHPITKAHIDKASCLSACVGRRAAVIKPTVMSSRRPA
jgi:hypothetical protein